MKCSVMFIFCIVSCFGMEQYSRLEVLPTDLKLNILKKAIRNADSRKQAIQTVRIWIAGDRLLRKNNGHITHQTTLEDHLGWHWRDEEWPLALASNRNMSKIFKSLWDQTFFRNKITDTELCSYQTHFQQFCKLVEAHQATTQELLSRMDLYHRYVTFEHSTDGRGFIFHTKFIKKTPLYVTVLANNITATIQLLEQGCDTQKLSDTGYNPLHVACKKGYKNLVALFIEYKVPLNAQTRVELKTAMHLAAENGHMDIMHMLVSAGAARDIKDSQGYIPAQHVRGRIAVG